MRMLALLFVAVFSLSMLTACGGNSEAPTDDIKARDAALKAKPVDPSVVLIPEENK